MHETEAGRMRETPIDWSTFCEVVRSHQTFVLTSHVRPDCDALGSELGMAALLRSLGKQALIVNADATPPNLAFIDTERQIQVLSRDVSPSAVQQCQVLMVLDTSAWIQLGDMADVVRSFPGVSLVVDHHVSEDDLGAMWFKDTAAEATGRLVAEAADALGVPWSPAIAQPLFAALATDTGWFRFSSATSATYTLAARMIDAGAKPSEIYNALYEQDSAGRVRLKGLILSRLVVELDGRLVHTHVLQTDFAAMGAVPSDTEDVVNLALTVAGTEFAVIFVELPNGMFKVSFRSRCSVDCSQIAQVFQGGGHRAAAGATMSGTLADVQLRVLDQVRRQLAKCVVKA